MNILKISLLMMFCLSILLQATMPVLAEEDSDSIKISDYSSSSNIEKEQTSLDFQDMLQPKESVKEVQDSSIGKPINKTNRLVVGGVVSLIFLALLIALAKYVWGNPSQISDGLMGMGGIVVGVLFFMLCGSLIFAMFTWG